MRWFHCCLIFCASLGYAGKNAFIVSQHSEETLEWVYELIAHADHSIELGAYSTGGQVLLDLFAALENRLKEKEELEVYFIAAPILLFEPHIQAIRYLEKNYPRFHFQNAEPHFQALPEYQTNENHMKCLIVDEKYFVLGGTNLHEAFCTKGTEVQGDRATENPISDSLPRGTRDMDLIGRGPCAKEIRTIFHQMYGLWKNFEQTCYFEDDPSLFQSEIKPREALTQITKFESSPRKVEVEEVKLIFGGPHQKQNEITKEYERLVHLAKKEIVIGNFYFNPVPTLFKKITDAIVRGVSFKLITNGDWEGAPFYATLLCWGNRVNYVPLFYGRDFYFWEQPDEVKKNVKIFEYQVEDVLYHKKVMVVDKKHTIIGSYNLNPKSDSADYEMALVVNSRKIAEDVLEVLRKDRTLSKEVSPNEAKEWYFDPLISYKGAFQKLFQGFL